MRTELSTIKCFAITAHTSGSALMEEMQSPTSAEGRPRYATRKKGRIV